MRTNYVISAAWAMAIVDLADLGMHFLPALPTRLELAAIVIALGGALWFAKWYPQQIKTHRSLSAENGLS